MKITSISQKLFIIFIYISASIICFQPASLLGQENCQGETKLISGSLFDVHFVDTLNGFIASRNILYKTSDGGNSWKEIDCVKPRNQGAKFQFPTRQTGYIFDRDATVYKSEDSGESWFKLNPERGGKANDIFFINADTGYIALRSSHLLRTEDGGITWKDTLVPSGLEGILNVQFLNDTVGFLLGDNDFIRRINLNQKWDTLDIPLNPNFSPRAMWFEDEDRGWVIAVNGRINELYQTLDGGQNWTIYPDVPQLRRWQNFDINTFYAVTSSDSLFKSVNGGAVWTTSIGPSPLSNLNGLHFLDENWGLVVGGSNLQGEGRLVAKTRDGGDSWEIISELNSGEITDIQFVNDSLVYLINETSSIYKSKDRGISWEEVYQYNSIPPTNRNAGRQIHFFDALHGVAFTQELMMSTQDGGQNWTVSQHPDNSLIFDAIKFYNDSIWIMVNPISAQLPLRITRNAGQSWMDLPDIIRPFDLHIISPDTLIAPEGNKVYRSVDGGTTWIMQYEDPDPNAFLRQIEFVNDSMTYVAGNDGKVLTTTDSGLTWVELNLPASVNADISMLEFFDENFGYAAIRGSFFVYEITNQGQDWEFKSVGDINSIDIQDPEHAYIAGDRGGISIISPRLIPCQPSYIRGNTNSCFETQAYHVKGESNSDIEFLWEISGGGNINSNGNLASVTWSDTGQFQLFVRQVTDCDTSLAQELSIHVSNVVEPLIEIVDAFTLVTDAQGQIQWFLDGSPISGANSDTLIISSQGNYSVLNTNECGSAMSNIVTDLIDKGMLGIKAFPNPVEDMLIIESESLIRQGEWELFNNLGQQIVFGKLEEGYRTNIDLKSINRGLHLLKIKTSEGRMVLKLLLK